MTVVVFVVETVEAVVRWARKGRRKAGGRCLEVERIVTGRASEC